MIYFIGILLSTLLAQTILMRVARYALHPATRIGTSFPPDSYWSAMEHYELHTVLGHGVYSVQARQNDAGICLKPGEDSRIRKHQAGLFVWAVSTVGSEISTGQLRYLLNLYGLRFSELSAATGIPVKIIRDWCWSEDWNATIEDSQIILEWIVTQMEKQQQ